MTSVSQARERDRVLNARDRALLLLAGAIVIVAMACTTALVILAGSDGVAAGAGVFTAGCTVAGAAVGRLGPSRDERRSDQPDPGPPYYEPPTGDDIFTTPESEL